MDQPRLLADLPPRVEGRPPRRLSVSALVAYARCPRLGYWTFVEPMPRTANPAARVGSVVHGWIERRAAGQGSLLDDAGGHPAPGAGEDTDRIEGLREAFLRSPYAEIRPRAVERAFAVACGGWVVRGRVDAVFDRDGTIEVVDFKTGRRPAADDRSTGVQMDCYALAAVDCWGHDPGRLRTTVWYLATSEGDSVDFDRGRLDAVRARLAGELDAVAAGAFEPLPGSYCRRCDFVGRAPRGVGRDTRATAPNRRSPAAPGATGERRETVGTGRPGVQAASGSA